MVAKLTLPEARIVVISPHLDDAALSLGATISAATAIGTRVDVVTVFGGDPESVRPSGDWDRQCGFTTEGEAVRGRRHEDAQACALLGVTPTWLPYGDEQYRHFGDRSTVAKTLEEKVRGFDVLLMPGYPLLNRDHAWLSRELLSRQWPGKRVGLYAEQPYIFEVPRARRSLGTAAALTDILPACPPWFRLPTTSEHRLRKQTAIAAYRSQSRMLHLGRFRLAGMLRQEASLGGEGIAWVA